MKIFYLVFFLLIVLNLTECKSKDNLQNPHKPNIVFIFADDLGYGDLACYGAHDIKTPNIDKIAKEGIKFTDFYSASSVCSPSRAAFLTGRLPQRMGINHVFFPESFTGMPQQEITIAELLKEKGYSTGIIGKWHLGHHYQYLPLQQGFDYYFGIPYSNDMESVVYMRNNEVIDFEVNQSAITKTYTTEAINFINKHKDQPFFLYIAHNMPHVPIYASKDFLEKSNRGLYGDVVSELDWSVGEIMQELEKLGLLENTLLIFSSDNGPWLAMKEYGGSAGILREGKQYTFEGGMKVPGMAMWKNKIPPGTVHKGLASQMDWFPTFAEIVNSNLTKNLKLDGVSILNVLTDNMQRSDSTLLYFDGNDLQCFRCGQWKVKLPFKGFKGARWKKAVQQHDTLLFNLVNDPGEKKNLFPLNRKKACELLQIMKTEYKLLGTLPKSLIVKSPADESHYKYLKRSKNLSR